MFKLFQYEFRKSLFPKLVFLCITGVFEVVFLIGALGEKETPTGIGIVGLTFAALAGIAYMGIESILTLYRDLTTKQSYMLFMTPNSSYKILGAKSLENGLAVFLSGVFFGGLAYLDISLLSKDEPVFKMVIDMINTVLREVDPTLKLSFQTFAAVLFMLLVTLILRIVLGYFAVVLACTLLAGKKGASVIALIIYVAISVGLSFLLNLLPEMKPVTDMMVQSCINLAVSVAVYFLTAWIMDKKLSV